MPGERGPRELLLDWLDRLIAGRVPAEIQLDLIEAAGQSNGARVSRKAQAVRIVQARDDPAGTLSRSALRRRSPSAG